MDAAHLAALGVIVNLVFTFAHVFVKSPAKTVQLDNIEQKIDGVIAAVEATVAVAGKDSK